MSEGATDAIRQRFILPGFVRKFLTPKRTPPKAPKTLPSYVYIQKFLCANI